MVTPQLSQPGLSGIFGCKGRVLLSRRLHRWEMTVGRCLQRLPGPSPPLHQPSPTPGPTAAARTPQYPPRSSRVRLTRSPTVSRSSRTFSSRSRFLSVSVSTISSAPRAASTCRHTRVSPAWRCSRPTVGHRAGCGTRLVTTAPSQGCGFATAQRVPPQSSTPAEKPPKPAWAAAPPVTSGRAPKEQLWLLGGHRLRGCGTGQNSSTAPSPAGLQELCAPPAQPRSHRVTEHIAQGRSGWV